MCNFCLVILKIVYIYIFKLSLPKRNYCFTDNEQSDAYSCDAYKGDDNIMFEDKDVNLAQESLKLASCLKDEKNNNFGLEGLPLNNSIKLVSDNDNLYSSPAKESFVQDLNISRESDMAKFPNIL